LKKRGEDPSYNYLTATSNPKEMAQDFRELVEGLKKSAEERREWGKQLEVVLDAYKKFNEFIADDYLTSMKSEYLKHQDDVTALLRESIRQRKKPSQILSDFRNCCREANIAYQEYRNQLNRLNEVLPGHEVKVWYVPYAVARAIDNVVALGDNAKRKDLKRRKPPRVRVR